MNKRYRYRVLGLLAFTLSLCSPALAQRDALTWEGLSGPYGGSISHLVADSSGNLYAVLGGAFTNARIYMKEKGGGAWTKQAELDMQIQGVAASPSGLLVAATEGGGVIRSSDHGAHWSPAPGFDNGFVWGIAVLGDGRVAAGGEFGDVSLSTDDGDSWERVAQLPNGVFIQRTAIGSDGEIFLGTTDAGVYVAADNGGGWGVSKVALDEGITALRAMPNGDLLAGTISGKIDRIRKNGESWMLVSSDSLDGIVSSIELSPAGSAIAATGTGLYAGPAGDAPWLRLDATMPLSGVSSMVIMKEGDLYAATRDGAFHAADITASQIRFEPVDAGMAALKIVALASASDGGLLAGTMSGTLYRSTDNGGSWTKVLVMPTVGQNSLYGGINHLAVRGSDLYASTYGSGIYRSSDNGATWSARNEGLSDRQMINVGIDSSGGVIASSIVMGLYRSTDAGEQWSRLSLDQGYVPAVTVAPNGDLLAGVGEIVMRSTDNGATWSSVRTMANVVVALLGAGSGEIYVGTVTETSVSTGALYRIGTNSAVKKIAAMPGSVGALAIDRGGTLYVGLDGGGVYILPPGATTVIAASNGLADSSVRALALGRDGDRIYAGVGGGIFVGSIAPAGVDEEDDRSVAGTLGLCSPNPASSGTIIPFSLAARAHVRLEIYNAVGAIVTTLLSADLPAGEHTAAWNTRDMEKGVYWYMLRVGGKSRTRMVVVGG